MNDPDKRFNELIQKLRKVNGLCPMTNEEAEAAFDAAPADPMTKDKIRSIVESVVSGELANWDSISDPVFDSELDVSEVEQGVGFIHRNAGEGDEAADATEDELRDELLSDSDEEQTGMDEGEDAGR